MVSEVCPGCGATEHRRVRPKTLIAFTSDRVCLACGVRYSPPTPRWAAVLFVLVGLLLTGFGLISILVQLASGNPLHILGMACEGFLGFLGLLALGQGIRALMFPGKV
jgi:hypothetical protein